MWLKEHVQTHSREGGAEGVFTNTQVGGGAGYYFQIHGWGVGPEAAAMNVQRRLQYSKIIISQTH